MAGMLTVLMSGMQIVLLAVGGPLEAIASRVVVESPRDTLRSTVNGVGDLYGEMIVDHYTRPI